MSSKHTIHLIGGARPNFMKIAPLVRAMDARPDDIGYRIVHTGQHYDAEMSDVFFKELGIPTPHHHLGCGGGSHAEQTAKIMVAYEKLCLEGKPDAVVVVGDVNSTLACSIVAKKLWIPVAHVEAGLRSGDMRMPEEINRLVTDSICDWYFVTEPAGKEHLEREGKPDEKIHFVGHVMVDNVIHQKSTLEGGSALEGPAADFKKKHQRYGAMTLHRPSNVDEETVFKGLAEALREISTDLPLAFPVHPRTRANMEKFGIDFGDRVELLPPLGYMDFLNLWKDAAMVLTDSGGLQEETTALGVPCLTLRENTERPITIDQGTNILVGTDPKVILAEARKILAGETKSGQRPELWDGKAAERTVELLIDGLGSSSQ
ncbi:MAG: UDP-N-acetylglucosamine 2-epimerase (non-hydrolyzing) [Verrucomicrobiota bacterium]